MLAYGRAIARRIEPPRIAGADGVAERLFVFEGRFATADARDRSSAMIRAFGEGLVSLFGRDLRHTDLLALFSLPDRLLLQGLIASAAGANDPALARGLAATRCGLALGLELMVMPLRADMAGSDRFLGHFQPLGGEAFTTGAHIERIGLTALYPPAPRRETGIRLVVSNE
jgi:hypothetical protein